MLLCFILYIVFFDSFIYLGNVRMLMYLWEGQGGDFVYTFLFKKRRCSSVLAFRRFLFFEAISPAFENTRSHGTDEAGVHKNCSDSRKRFGYMFLWFSQYFEGSWDLGMLPSTMYFWTSIIASAVTLVVCLPTSSSRCFHRFSEEQQIGILVHDLQAHKCRNKLIKLNNMPEVGADSCCEEGPGCGSVNVRPITAAHSDFSLLTASLLLEELRNPSDLYLGSRRVDRVNTLNDSRLEAVSVTRRLRCSWSCIAACVCKFEALRSSAW